MPDVSKIIASSAYDGFKNIPPTLTKSKTFVSQSLAAFDWTSSTISVDLPTGTDVIEMAQIKYGGVDDKTYIVPGVISKNYPKNSSPKYQLETIVYITGGKLYAKTFIVNQSGGSSVTIPTINFKFTAFIYNAPF